MMTHGVRGIDWKHYKHPLPEQVYDAYMRSWNGVVLQLKKEKDHSAVEGALR
jgi:hypothetical protein